MDAHDEAVRGLQDIERFLYRESHLAAAHRRVAAFTTRMRGLTRAERSAVERWYLDEQRYVARLVTQHIAERVGAVEERHRTRHRRWLRGMVSALVLAVGATAALCVGLA